MRNPFKRFLRRAPGNRPFSVRSFAAAQVDRLLSGWSFDGGWCSREISSSLETIRSRSREMSKNSTHFKRWLGMVAINIVGEGFTVKFTPHDGLADKQKLDVAAAKILDYHFWRWCTFRDPETKNTWCDASGRKTFSEILRMCAKTWARDGEYFLQVVPADNPYRMALRVLRPDMCDHSYNADATATGNIIRCGVEQERATGKPVAYWMFSKGDGCVNTTRGPRLRIPANQIIHGFTPEDEDQPRGIPWGHASLRKLKMIEELDVAELTAARDESCSVRSYYAPKGEEDVIKDLTTEENAEAAAALTADKEAGQSEVLPIGWKMEVHTPQHPNGQHGPFKSGMLRDVASGFNVEYANFANDWSGVNFSSVRLGTISERDYWTIMQNDMIAQTVSPVVLLWLKSFILLSDIPHSLPYSKIEKFAEHEVRGRRWMWVDPMKDMSAAKTAVENNWKTNTQVAADLGADYGDNIEESKREQAMVSGEKKESLPVLGSAQVSSSLVVVQQYAVGAIGKEAAIALLTAAGVPIEAATNVINKQKIKEAVA